MDNTINTLIPSFKGKLILNEKSIKNRYLAEEVLNNKTLQMLVEESDADFFISQSEIRAKSAERMHYEGDRLYKIFLSKKDDSFMGKIKNFLGLNKISLSRNYHLPETFYDKILQPSHLKKLNLK